MLPRWKIISCFTINVRGSAATPTLLVSTSAVSVISAPFGYSRVFVIPSSLSVNAIVCVCGKDKSVGCYCVRSHLTRGIAPSSRHRAPSNSRYFPIFDTELSSVSGISFSINSRADRLTDAEYFASRWVRIIALSVSVCTLVCPLANLENYRKTRNPAVAGMADRTAPVVKLTRQKIVIPSGIGLAAVLAVGQLCLSL